MSEDFQALGHSKESVGVVAVLGGSGFVGRTIVSELRERGIEVCTVPAPRLHAVPDELVNGVRGNLDPDVVEALAQRLERADVVINAAGVADPAAPDSPSLYGANTLLPLVAARACALAKANRLVHVSSISVQGDGDLDETARTAPFSPYSRSRALGEGLLLGQSDIDTVIFRPSSVHGVSRAVTRSLVRFAQSSVSCVAGKGLAPTPQVLVSDVAASLAHLALARGPVPPIVIQPPNGMTTGLLLRLLGGHEPRHLPELLARHALRGIRAGARGSLRATAHARRIEMLLFGRRQVPGWLSDIGFAPALRPQDWQRLGLVLAQTNVRRGTETTSAMISSEANRIGEYTREGRGGGPEREELRPVEAGAEAEQNGTR